MPNEPRPQSSPKTWGPGRQDPEGICGRMGVDGMGDQRGPCLLEPGHAEPHEDRPANVLVILTARIKATRERIEEALR